MGEAAKKRNYSIEEYLALQQSSEEKYEYHAGEVFAMAGGTINHNRIAGNLHALINDARRSGQHNCEAFINDVRLRVDSVDSYVYPDVFAVCGKIETDEKDPSAIINASLVVEVLSKSTAAYDRQQKFRRYCAMPTFKEYVLIDQDVAAVDILYREGKGIWEMRTHYGLDTSFELRTLGITVTMRELYDRVTDLQEDPLAD